CQQRSSYPHTF
nr:immunoglobulin light chain junction region [Mus musculus]